MDEILNAAILLGALREFPEQEIAPVQTPAAAVAVPAGVQPAVKPAAVAAPLTKRNKLVNGAKAVKTTLWKRGTVKLSAGELATRREWKQKDIVRRRANREESARLRKEGNPFAISAHVKDNVQHQLRNKRHGLTQHARMEMIADAVRVKAGEPAGSAQSYMLACVRLYSAYDVARTREAVISAGVAPLPGMIEKIAEVKELCVLAERVDVIATARAAIDA